MWGKARDHVGDAGDRERLPTVDFERVAINAFGELPHIPQSPAATSTSANRCFGAFIIWDIPGNSGHLAMSNSGRRNSPRYRAPP